MLEVRTRRDRSGGPTLAALTPSSSWSTPATRTGSRRPSWSCWRSPSWLRDTVSPSLSSPTNKTCPWRRTWPSWRRSWEWRILVAMLVGASSHVVESRERVWRRLSWAFKSWLWRRGERGADHLQPRAESTRKCRDHTVTTSKQFYQQDMSPAIMFLRSRWLQSRKQSETKQFLINWSLRNAETIELKQLAQSENQRHCGESSNNMKSFPTLNSVEWSVEWGSSAEAADDQLTPFIKIQTKCSSCSKTVPPQDCKIPKKVPQQLSLLNTNPPILTTLINARVCDNNVIWN